MMTTKAQQQDEQQDESNELTRNSFYRRDRASASGLDPEGEARH